MLLSLSALLALCSVASAASSSAARWQSLAAKSGGVIKLNARSFDEITASPRNYSVSVTLTALHPNFKCQPCRVFDAEARLVAKSWLQHRESSEHFFAVLDFPDGRDVFTRLGLQTAPNTRLYMPTEGPRASSSRDAENYDISRSGPSAEAFAQFIRSTAKVPLTFRRPPNYTAMGSTAVTVVLLGGATYWFWDAVSKIIFGRWLWAMITNLFIISMTGGYMWNQIRHPPFAQPGQDGRVNYIAGGYQNQYGIETQIVGGIYAVLAFSAYTLVVTIPWISDPWRQRVAVYIWGFTFFFMASVLVSIFTAKQPGYPFKLLLQ